MTDYFMKHDAVMDVAKANDIHAQDTAFYCWCGHDHYNEVSNAVVEKFIEKLEVQIKALVPLRGEWYETIDGVQRKAELLTRAEVLKTIKGNPIIKEKP